MKGYINSFESFGTKDGPGIRFVVFLQGCPLRCQYCHNVDTWDLRGKNYIQTPEDVLKELYKVKGFLTGGITVSGGEPLLQPGFLVELFKLCREQGIHTALDTSGYIFDDNAKKVLEYTDLVLLDIKHIDKDVYKELTSVDLEPTLNFIKYLQKIGKPVWIRYVLVPGLTDDNRDL
ncbi:MAG: pyruvate formate lyase-activating protein, partial [Fusobacterium sp.]|nr:pyruvate formate lyase-activating protein [Fusobacterium sp.]